MSEHVSVLLNEAVEALNIKPDGIYVDATLGGGGHASAILSQLKTGLLIGLDQDPYALEYAKKKLLGINDRFQLYEVNFESLADVLMLAKVKQIDGIIYDLGVSSFQFDTPERGFSYRFDAPLDMRMSPNAEVSAFEIVNTWEWRELARIFSEYGEEAFAGPIARNIEKRRNIKPIETTFELVDVIKEVLPEKIKRKKGHPAKQTFQALRIAVNDELNRFEKSLLAAIDFLAPSGRVVVITFHSLEDRIAKTVFKRKSTLTLPKGVPIIDDRVAPLTIITRKPIMPNQKECEENPRARSAKLRVAEKNEVSP